MNSERKRYISPRQRMSTDEYAVYLKKRAANARAKYVPKSTIKYCPDCKFLWHGKKQRCDECGHMFYPQRSVVPKKPLLRKQTFGQIYQGDGEKLYEFPGGTVLFFRYFGRDPLKGAGKSILTYSDAMMAHLLLWGYTINGGTAKRDFPTFQDAFSDWLSQTKTIS